MVSYDFETTRIQAGTPRPVYLTAYAPGLVHVETSIRDMEHLAFLIASEFLRLDLEGCYFVGWNANRFDAVFIAAALVLSPAYRIRPFMTRDHQLRGMRVEMIDQPVEWKGKKAPAWLFVDGVAQLGLVGVSLAKFLSNFAPDLPKLSGVIDFDGGEEFDPENAAHRDYAMRDSVGLWHGMNRAQSIMVDRFNEPLRVTMGGVGIRIFTAHIPAGVQVWPLKPEPLRVVRQWLMRGGYCFCVRQFHGPIWKYDLNQAYAAAMREAKLPAGGALHTIGAVHGYAQVYMVRVTGTNPHNRIPLYCRTLRDGRMRSVFAVDVIPDTWLTCIEYEQLLREGWRFNVVESYTFDQHFSMREFVDSLELMRSTCEGGPAGPIGTMLKMTGNHCYGKFSEEIDGTEFCIARDMPDGYSAYYADGATPIEHVWQQMHTGDDAPVPKTYHQPHVSAWITAHVRMVVRRAALLAPDAWLYADTDCVVFDRDVTADLDIHPSRYGAWKIEEAGTVYRIIAKKVYAVDTGNPNEKPTKKSAKGLNVKHLTDADFAAWLDGDLPSQDQVQRNSFLRVMQGAEMFKNQSRTGTATEKSLAKDRARVQNSNAPKSARNR